MIGERKMFIHVCKAKIHRATVNELDLDYEGSITIDRDLMDAAHLDRKSVV